MNEKFFQAIKLFLAALNTYVSSIGKGVDQLQNNLHLIIINYNSAFMNKLSRERTNPLNIFFN